MSGARAHFKVLYDSFVVFRGKSLNTLVPMGQTPSSALGSPTASADGDTARLTRVRAFGSLASNQSCLIEEPDSVFI